jgi:hypothetical protein
MVNLSSGAQEVLKMFALNYVKSGGRPVAVSRKTLMIGCAKRGIDFESTVKELIDAGCLNESKGKYLLTKYGWTVSQEIWGKGLEKLVPVGWIP